MARGRVDTPRFHRAPPGAVYPETGSRCESIPGPCISVQVFSSWCGVGFDCLGKMNYTAGACMATLPRFVG